MAATASCPLCNSHDEGTIHLLRDCAWVHIFWRSVPGLPGSFFSQDFHVWFRSNLQGRVSVHSYVDWPRFFVTALWGVWYLRNGWVFGQTEATAAKLWGVIRSLAIEHQVGGDVSAQAQGSGTVHNVFDSGLASLGGRRRSWKPPEEGWLKCNVDGALTTALMAGCGGVIRNHQGAWVKAFCRNLGPFGFANVFLAELSAVSAAVEVIMSLDFSHVIIESDSMQVVNLLTSPDWHIHPLVDLLQPLMLMVEAHGHIVFKHIPREANAVADYLAHVSIGLVDGTHLFDSPFGECHRLVSLDFPEVAPSVS